MPSWKKFLKFEVQINGYLLLHHSPRKWVPHTKRDIHRQLEKFKFEKLQVVSPPCRVGWLLQEGPWQCSALSQRAVVVPSPLLPLLACCWVEPDDACVKGVFLTWFLTSPKIWPCPTFLMDPKDWVFLGETKRKVVKANNNDWVFILVREPLTSAGLILRYKNQEFFPAALGVT